jgi:hypothetical protein
MTQTCCLLSKSVSFLHYPADSSDKTKDPKYPCISRTGKHCTRSHPAPCSQHCRYSQCDRHLPAARSSWQGTADIHSMWHPLSLNTCLPHNQCIAHSLSWPCTFPLHTPCTCPRPARYGRSCIGSQTMCCSPREMLNSPDTYRIQSPLLSICLLRTAHTWSVMSQRLPMSTFRHHSLCTLRRLAFPCMSQDCNLHMCRRLA